MRRKNEILNTVATDITSDGDDDRELLCLFDLVDSFGAAAVSG